MTNPVDALPPSASLAVFAVAGSNGTSSPSQSARPAIIDEIARASSADVVDWRNALVASSQALEFLIEAEDGPLGCLVDVAGSASAGGEVLAGGWRMRDGCCAWVGVGCAVGCEWGGFRGVVVACAATASLNVGWGRWVGFCEVERHFLFWWYGGGKGLFDWVLA